MADETQNDGSKTGLIQSLLNPPKCSMLRMIVVGIVGGVIIWGGLNTAMEWTNRSDFCMSCHEMTIPFEELKKTVHYKNRSGTTVQCADCHVASSKTPTDYIFKSFQKLMAARDVIGHIKGTVDTKEKFDEHRLIMAQRRVVIRIRSACLHSNSDLFPDTGKILGHFIPAGKHGAFPNFKYPSHPCLYLISKIEYGDANVENDFFVANIRISWQHRCVTHLYGIPSLNGSILFILTFAGLCPRHFPKNRLP